MSDTAHLVNLISSNPAAPITVANEAQRLALNVKAGQIVYQTNAPSGPQIGYVLLRQPAATSSNWIQLQSSAAETTDDILNESDVAGTNLTDALNTLLAQKMNQLPTGTGAVLPVVNTDGSLSRTAVNVLSGAPVLATSNFATAPTTKLNAAVGVENLYTLNLPLPNPVNTTLGLQPYWSDLAHIGGNPGGMQGSFGGGFTVKGWNDNTTGHDIHNVFFSEGDLWLNNDQNASTSWGNNWRQAAFFDPGVQAQADGITDVILSLRSSGRLKLARALDINPIFVAPAYARAGIAALPANPLLSQVNEAVTSQDIRLSELGGVSLVGDGGATPGYGSAVSFASGEFYAQFLVRPKWGNTNRSILFATDDGTNKVTFGFGRVVSNTDLSQPAYLFTYDYTSGNEYVAPAGKTWQQLINAGLNLVTFYRAPNGVLSAFLSGIALTWSSTPPARLGPVIRLFGGVIGGFGQFQGDVVSSRFINFNPTPDEIASMQKGESSGRLVIPVLFSTPLSSFSVIGNVNGRLAIAGNSITKTAGAETGPFACFAKIGNSLSITPYGARVRVPLTVSLTSGSAADLPALILGDYGSMVATPISMDGGAYPGRLQPGTHVYEFATDYTVHDPYGNHYLSLNWGDIYGGTAGGTAFTLAQPVVLESEGNIADYRPENVTESTIWCDLYGNDLRSPGGAKALNPTSAFVRALTGNMVDTTIPGVRAGVNEALVGFSTSSPLLQAVRAGDAMSLSMGTAVLPQGLFVKSTICSSDGVVFFSGVNNNGSNENTGAPACTVTQTLY